MDLVGPLERGIVTNDALADLQADLLAAKAAGTLDGFGLYLLATVLKVSRCGAEDAETPHTTPPCPWPGAVRSDEELMLLAGAWTG